MKKNLAIALLLFLEVLGTRAFPADETVPEFGTSVSFEKGRELSLAKLRGKAVLVMLFQSWCPICNGWSGELLQQITQRHGENPKVVLVALKTDGGTLGSAKQYLEERKVDTSKWFVGLDQGAGFYRKIDPKTPLWTVLVVDPDGKVVKQEMAGIFVPQAGGGKEFKSARIDIDKEAGGERAKLLLPAEKKWTGPLSEAARLAEAGCLASALLLCLKQGNDAQAGELKGLLLESLEKRWAELEAHIANAEAPSKERYPSLLQLREELLQLKGSPQAQKWEPKVRKLEGEKSLLKEGQAEKAYRQMMANVDALKKETERKAALRTGLKSFAGFYKDTYFAEQALAALERLDQIGPSR